MNFDISFPLPHGRFEYFFLYMTVVLDITAALNVTRVCISIVFVKKREEIFAFYSITTKHFDMLKSSSLSFFLSLFLSLFHSWGRFAASHNCLWHKD